MLNTTVKHAAVFFAQELYPSYYSNTNDVLYYLIQATTSPQHKETVLVNPKALQKKDINSYVLYSKRRKCQKIKNSRASFNSKKKSRTTSVCPSVGGQNWFGGAPHQT